MSNEESNEKVVITEEDKTYLLDHDYDGIKECNYPLPFWWVGIFWATIIFSVGYVGYFLMGGKTLNQEFTYDMKVVKALRGELERKEAKGGFDMEAYKSADLALGKAKFTQLCAACHGANGEGGIGPNLTDNFWLYGPKPADHMKVIIKGTAKGMPPYGNLLKKTERFAVDRYIETLYGTKPANAKEPQGKEY